jgi:PadR family transcriptional regulator, regulatory protein PadR
MEQHRTPRMTIPTQLVLRALLADASKEQYGVEVGAAAGLPSGTVHPILARLETAGWLQSRWEEIDPRAEGRPARRYYRLTPDGVEPARPPAWWASLAVRSAAPGSPSEHRQRYRQEFLAELCRTGAAWGLPTASGSDRPTQLARCRRSLDAGPILHARGK